MKAPRPPLPIPAKPAPNSAAGTSLNGAEAPVSGAAIAMNAAQRPIAAGADQSHSIGSFKKGGVVKKTGPYKVHKGERVVNNDVLTGRRKTKKIKLVLIKGRN